ncbi:DUF3291 domain-containing protein [Ahniella affigens]|uniref:DUF3291 domain-containing protein n=1 Tax=Ahniella affigens TaxID=2021234 RepID=A0A2P1PPZ9_9GAMM|nr:DUF3291 domain-containing protein [Ahniella affigens]AVP96921.1 DUF3291 domain-containing protein [Ahniella affigens]
MPFQLAQINVALAKDDLNSPALAGFVSQLAETNERAEASPGFVWRLKDYGDANTIQIEDNPRLIVNMSVWETLESLRHFVYKTPHIGLIQARAQWFEKLDQAHTALWWQPSGHPPTLAEGLERLNHLRAHGPTATAFTFGKLFPSA